MMQLCEMSAIQNNFGQTKASWIRGLYNCMSSVESSPPFAMKIFICAKQNIIYFEVVLTLKIQWPYQWKLSMCFKKKNQKKPWPITTPSHVSAPTQNKRFSLKCSFQKI